MRVLQVIISILLAQFPVFAQTGAGRSPAQPNAPAAVDKDSIAADPFEGTFTVEVQRLTTDTLAPEAPTITRVWVAGTKALIATGSGPEEKKVLKDLEAKVFYSLTVQPDGKKIAMFMPMAVPGDGGTDDTDRQVVVHPDYVPEADTLKDPPVTSYITRVDETRTIAGHACSKVVSTYPGIGFTAWVARDVQVDLWALFGGTAESGIVIELWKTMNGLPMELVMSPLDNLPGWTIQVVAINQAPVDPKVFSLEGYEIRPFPPAME